MLYFLRSLSLKSCISPITIQQQFLNIDFVFCRLQPETDGTAFVLLALSLKSYISACHHPAVARVSLKPCISTYYYPTTTSKS